MKKSKSIFTPSSGAIGPNNTCFLNEIKERKLGIKDNCYEAVGEEEEENI